MNSKKMLTLATLWLALSAILQPGISFGAAVPIPTGFLLMCADHPNECRGGGASRIQYTAELIKTLRQVNAGVNAYMKPVRNERGDVWTANAPVGDCEEYVLAKRRQLIKRGVPASALSIVYALRNGGGHAILAVHTYKADFVLDNMTQSIVRLNQTGYQVISMSGPNPMIWHRP